jgi:hypothetical protein
MNARGSRIVVLVVLTGSMAGGGCDSGNSGPKVVVSTVEATVTGKVTANGVPVSKGKVTVTPPGPPFVENIADIQKDGTYKVKTYIGKNAFSVVGTGSPAAGEFYNKKRFEVKEGSNTIDLELPLKEQ